MPYVSENFNLREWVTFLAHFRQRLLMRELGLFEVQIKSHSLPLLLLKPLQGHFTICFCHLQ
jgi:hypothetical protein